MTKTSSPSSEPLLSLKFSKGHLNSTSSLSIFFFKGKKCLNLAAHETNDGQELKKKVYSKRTAPLEFQGNLKWLAMVVSLC